MSNYKRKKKKTRDIGWTVDGKKYSETKGLIDADEQINPNPQKHTRKKSKSVVIMAKSKPGKARWWNKRGTKDWFIWKRYEKINDATNALKTLTRSGYQAEIYEFRIDCVQNLTLEHTYCTYNRI